LVPELLRLLAMEHDQIIYQMGIQPLCEKLGVVQDTGQIFLPPLTEPATKHEIDEKERYLETRIG
jgi:hypothetical protein